MQTTTESHSAQKVIRYKIACPCCGRLIISDMNNRPFKVEELLPKDSDKYHKVTRCPRCKLWIGVYN